MLGHLIYSYNHLDDARIQQEISKIIYTPVFGKVYIVHAHNGKKSFRYKKYLEDKLIRINNRGHFQGACDLINSGIKYFQTKAPKSIRYVLVTAADTWCLNTGFLNKIINQMKDQDKVLAVSSWSKSKYPERIEGFSTDFFIIDIKWASQTNLFPLHFNEFKRKFSDILSLLWKMPNIERTLQYQYNRYFMSKFQNNDIWQNRDKKIFRIIEREPIHHYVLRHDKKLFGERINNWPKIGLYTSPDPKEKQKVLKKMNLVLGPNSKKLIKAKNLSYYNKK